MIRMKMSIRIPNRVKRLPFNILAPIIVSSQYIESTCYEYQPINILLKKHDCHPIPPVIEEALEGMEQGSIAWHCNSVIYIPWLHPQENPCR